MNVSVMMMWLSLMLVQHSMFVLRQQRFKETRFITSSSQAEMGFTIPACIGAAFAKDGDVIGVTGDGSFMMNLQELETIAYYNLPSQVVRMEQ